VKIKAAPTAPSEIERARAENDRLRAKEAQLEANNAFLRADIEETRAQIAAVTLEIERLRAAAPAASEYSAPAIEDPDEPFDATKHYDLAEAFRGTDGFGQLLFFDKDARVTDPHVLRILHRAGAKLARVKTHSESSVPAGIVANRPEALPAPAPLSCSASDVANPRAQTAASVSAEVERVGAEREQLEAELSEAIAQSVSAVLDGKALRPFGEIRQRLADLAVIEKELQLEFARVEAIEARAAYVPAWQAMVPLQLALEKALDHFKAARYDADSISWTQGGAATEMYSVKHTQAAFDLADRNLREATAVLENAVRRRETAEKRCADLGVVV
jgi:hypothetical protein